MKLTNNQIYTYATNLIAEFNDESMRFPIKVNFYLQKNKDALMSLAQDIEKVRMDILNTYGSPSEDGAQFIIAPEKISEAQKELSDLFELEQEVNIYKVSIDAFGDGMVLSTKQMEALMFMID